MRDMLVELLDAKTNKIYKENEFESLLLSLGSLSEGLTINWDSGAGEEWAFVNNNDFNIMLNRRIGICFVRGILDISVSSCLSQCKCVFVAGYDLEEWYIDLDKLNKCIPEIKWPSQDYSVDPHCFSLNDFYYATV